MNKQRIIEILDITDTISKTFCLAKWHHTTIYLQSGETHSCYHPTPHTIPLDELEHNPSALHNTSQKKSERKEMLDGNKPSGCNYCWNIESMGSDYISDRKDRNATIYRPEIFSAIKDNPLGDVNPEYIEISFGNECNFKCGYCHPKASSSYLSEIKTHGRYPVKNHGFDVDGLVIYEEETNPYVEAWWKWWPEVSKTLNILRITGGEPLMHRSTWRLFDHLREDPKPNLELNLNSNLGVKSAMVEKFADNVNDILVNQKVKTFKLFSSMDSWGARAEYIRTGLDINLWEKNLDTYITKTNSPVSIMCTFNILSVTSFIEFLQKVLEWRTKYQPILNPGGYGRRIRFDVPYLKEPLQYDMLLLPKEEFLPHFDTILKFIEDNRDELDPNKFTDMEYEKFRRVRDYFATAIYSEEKIKEGRIDFYKWFTEHDQRRNVNFLETFPEMTNFWNLCKSLAETQHE
jgi:organic radical activating enzyme